MNNKRNSRRTSSLGSSALLEQKKSLHTLVHEIELKKYSFKHIFEVAVANESSNLSHDLLAKITNVASKFEDLSHMTLIMYGEIIDFMHTFPHEPERYKIPHDLTELTAAVCLECIANYQDRQEISANLLSLLIKLKLVEVMYTQFSNEVDRFNKEKRTEEEYNLYTAEMVGGTKGTKDVKGNKKDTKNNPGKKDIEKSKQKKVYEYEPEPITDSTEVESQIWFYILVGFYNPAVIKELILKNVPISALIQISISDEEYDRCYNPENITERESQFWLEISNQVDGPSRLRDLENTILLQYVPINGLDLTPKQYLEEFLFVIRRIHDLKLRHINYIRSLRLINIGDKDSINLELASSYLTYSKILDSFPSECINIPLIAQAIVEEICSRYDDNKTFRTEDQFKFKQDSKEKEKDPCVFSFDYFKPKQILVNNSNTSNISYQTHERNFLEHILRSYAFIGRKIYDISLKYLQKVPPIYFIKESFEAPVTDYNHTHDIANGDETKKDLSNRELYHIISTLVLSKINCKHEEPERLKTNNINEFLQIKDFRKKLDSIRPTRIEQSIKSEDYDISKQQDAGKNHYEKRNFSNYNWNESLSTATLLQEIYASYLEYNCMDYLYCDEIDSFLFRFHQNLDNFGINTTLCVANLRTPVCLRDFCRFTTTNDLDLLILHDTKLKETLEALILKEDCRGTHELSQKHSYFDYLYLLQNNKQNEETDSSKSEIKLPNILFELQNYPHESDSLRDQCQNNSEYVAFDLGSEQVQVDGSVTTFMSYDGVGIKIDSSHFLGRSENLSITLSSDNNFLTMHRVAEESSVLCQLQTAEDVIVSINKKIFKPETDKLAKENVESNNSREKFLTGAKNNGRPINLNTSSNRRSEDEDSDKKTNGESSPVRLENSKSLQLDEENNEQVMKDLFQEHAILISKPDILENEKYNLIQALNDYKKNPEGFKNSETFYDSILMNLIDIINNKSTAHKITLHKDIEKIFFENNDFPLKMPCFNLMKRILHDLSKGESQPTFLRKYLPIKASTNTDTNTIFDDLKYDLRITLPNGLQTNLIPSGSNSSLYEVKQKFLTKNNNESYRLFSRTGVILIRYPDGRVTIYRPNGEIMKLEKPYNLIDSLNNKLENVAKNCHNNIPCRDLIECKKQLQRIFCQSGETETDSFISRRSHLQKEQGHLGDCEYFDTGIDLPYMKYSVLKFDGRKVIITGDKITIQQKNFPTNDFDFRNEESFYERDDGFRCLYTREDGKMTVQFPDNTRITSWYTIEPDLIEISKKSGGWVSVLINYKFEHPDYVDVSYPSQTDMEIGVSDNLTIVKDAKSLNININQDLLISIEEEEVYFTKTCNKCELKCESKININNFCGLNSNNNCMEILNLKDSYNKEFRFHAIEKYSINENYIHGVHNKANCNHYAERTYEKLYAVKKDLSGTLFWLNANVEKKKENYQIKNERQLSLQTNICGFKYLEFLSTYYHPYSLRFMKHCLIDCPLNLSKYLIHDKEQENAAYVAYREIYEVLYSSKLYEVSLEIKGHIEEKLLKKSQSISKFFYDFMETIEESEYYKSLIAPVPEEEVDTRPPCTCLKIQLTSGEIIDYRKHIIEKYRDYITARFVPLYFLSEYYNK